mgnify:CR=1 FL=1
MSTYPSFRPYKSFKKMTKFKIIVHIWTITVQTLNFIPKQKYSSGKKPTNAHFMCLIYQGLFCTLYARVFFVPWIYASGIVRRRIFSRLLFILSQRVQLGIVFELVSRLMQGPVFLQFVWEISEICKILTKYLYSEVNYSRVLTTNDNYMPILKTWGPD